MSKESKYDIYASDIIKLLKTNPNKKEIAKQIADEHELNLGGLYDYIKGLDINDLPFVEEIDENDVYVEKTETDDLLKFNVYSTFIKGIDELIEYHGIDTDKWVASKIFTNYIEQGQKLRTIKKVKGERPIVVHRTNKVPLHQIKAEFKLKESLFDPERFIVALGEALSEKTPTKTKHKKSKRRDLLVEPFIVDHHIGNSIQDENYDMIYSIDIAEKFYDNAIDDFLDRIDTEKINRFLLPTGNDIVHFDNFDNKTTRGTQLFGNAADYERACVVAEAMSIRTIEKLAKIAPVDVPLVKSNHAFTTEFHIGRSLIYYFKDNPNVTILNSTRSRQYYRYKKIGLGFCHGHNEKIEELHNLFPIEASEIWHECNTLQFHIGHRHHFTKKKSFAKIAEEFRKKGLTVIQGSTMCFPDAWHIDKGFIGNEQRTQCLVFDTENHIDTKFHYPA